VAEAARINTVDDVGKFFWNFLKNELTPYPGRAWVVGRVTIAATLVMLVVMTFQIPLGFQGAVFTLFLTRENPTATFRAGLNTVLGFLAGTTYTLLSVMLHQPLYLLLSAPYRCRLRNGGRLRLHGFRRH
jgi:multidrug resistance protein MdtO